jgi:hypothetical protein
MDEEACRLNVQLFADVFAELDEILATLTASTGFWLVPMLNAGQFGRQGIAAGSFVRARCDGSFLLLCQLGHDGGAIFIAALDKQIALLARQGFTLAAKADAFVVGQFKRELLDLQLTSLQFRIPFHQLGIAFDEPGLQVRDLRLDPVR